MFQSIVDQGRDGWGKAGVLPVVAPSVADDPRIRNWWAQWERLSASLGVAARLLEVAFEIDIDEVESFLTGQRVEGPTERVLATFDGPARAVHCAQAVCEGVRRLGLDARAGVHTGEIEVGAGHSVRGIAVHIGPGSRRTASTRPRRLGLACWPMEPG